MMQTQEYQPRFQQSCEYQHHLDKMALRRKLFMLAVLEEPFGEQISPQ